jgi:probable F420-dependent oxidoreductase
MKYGVAFANIGAYAGPAEAVQLAVAVEAAGFESIWTVDHVVVPGGYRSAYPYDPTGRLPSGEGTVFPDPLIWLAYIAARTSTLRLGTGILIVPQRNPLVLAKELATLDSLSGGRMILGAGIGWLEEEFDALGVPFADRAPRMEESIAAMRALWTQEHASFDGVTTKFADCYLRPQPPGGTIPVHIGGHSRAAARRAGRIGDGFFPLGVSPEQLPPLIDLIRASAEEAGRDPDAVEVTMQCAAVTGDEAVAAVEALGRIGVSRVLIPSVLFGPEFEASLARYGEDVIGHA